MEGRPRDEEDLVERARRGDIGAYEELVQRYQGIAFRTAYLITGDAGDAEEAAQDGFVKAHRALGRFRPGAPFRPWLLRIVANEARNRRRSAGRRAALALRVLAHESSGDAAPSPEAAAGEAAPSPEAETVSRERRGELLAALERLREEERLVLAYRFLLGLSEEETAAALAVPEGTVKSRQSRGLARLRAELGARDG